MGRPSRSEKARQVRLIWRFSAFRLCVNHIGSRPRTTRGAAEELQGRSWDATLLRSSRAISRYDNTEMTKMPLRLTRHPDGEPVRYTLRENVPRTPSQRVASILATGTLARRFHRFLAFPMLWLFSHSLVCSFIAMPACLLVFCASSIGP